MKITDTPTDYTLESTAPVLTLEFPEVNKMSYPTNHTPPQQKRVKSEKRVQIKEPPTEQKTATRFSGTRAPHDNHDFVTVVLTPT